MKLVYSNYPTYDLHIRFHGIWLTFWVDGRIGTFEGYPGISEILLHRRFKPPGVT